MGQETIINQLPSAFVLEWLARLAVSGDRQPRALDLAMGRGRHALAMARAGWRVFGVDRRLDAVLDARDRARRSGLTVSVWCADLTSAALPPAAFDVIVVTRYLQRDLFPAIRNAVRRGGVVVYETFTVKQRTLGSGPTSPAHLLEQGELATCFESFDVLFYEEVESPEAVARVVARRRA